MELTGQKREKIGKQVKSLRAKGLIPAVVFGHELESTAIVVDRTLFGKLFDTAGETSLVDLKLEKHDYKVLINAVQYDPVYGKIIHATFYRPNLLVKTEVAVPVEIVGDEINALIKSGSAVVLQLMNEITVSALPTDLPEAFSVDISTLAEVGAGITVGQLQYDKTKVEIVDLDADELVVKLDNAQMAEEPEEVAATDLETAEKEALEKLEATGEKKPEDEEEGSEKSTGKEKSDKGTGDKK